MIGKMLVDKMFSGQNVGESSLMMKLVRSYFRKVTLISCINDSSM